MFSVKQVFFIHLHLTEIKARKLANIQISWYDHFLNSVRNGLDYLFTCVIQ